MKQGDLFGPAPARAALEARWLALTRVELPALAAAHGWPIRLDHCFMRVCLDAALGVPWTATVRRPALRHATDAAVRVAEGIAAAPGTLPALDAASRAGRRAAKGALRTGGTGTATSR